MSVIEQVAYVARVISDANGDETPHDGRFVKRWNPHTVYGICDLSSTDDLQAAKKFATASEAMAEWRTVSEVAPRRPDGLPNRPLTGLTIEILHVTRSATSH